MTENCLACGGILVCSHCRNLYGKFGAEAMAEFAKFESNEDEVAEHLENYHGFIIKRQHEKNMAEATKRCEAKGILLGHGRKCQCEECKDGRWLEEVRKLEL